MPYNKQMTVLSLQLKNLTYIVKAAASFPSAAYAYSTKQGLHKLQ